MPAYSEEKTLPQTVHELPDATVRVGEGLSLKVFTHDGNYGHGCNQQPFCREGLVAGAEAVMMLLPESRMADGAARQTPSEYELQEEIPTAHESRGPGL